MAGKADDSSSTIISVDDALRRVLAAAAERLPPVSVKLEDAVGLVLAEDVCARDPLPPYRASVKEKSIAD
ncbi:hypothetical protein ACLOJK_023042 [Asimina triloba]